jgi:hypothetical protein
VSGKISTDDAAVYGVSTQANHDKVIFGSCWLRQWSRRYSREQNTRLKRMGFSFDKNCKGIFLYPVGPLPALLMGGALPFAKLPGQLPLSYLTFADRSMTPSCRFRVYIDCLQAVPRHLMSSNQPDVAGWMYDVRLLLGC